jgi:uncharacterized membrane protein
MIIPATYALANEIYDKYTALLSAILIAILPGAIFYSTRGRGYSLVALFTVLIMYLAYYLRKTKNLYAWSLLVLFSALGFYSVPIMLFPFGIVFVWLIFDNLFTEPGPYKSKFNFLKYWFLAGISTAVLVLILYTPIFIYSGVNKVFANQFVTPKPWSGYISLIPNLILDVWQEWTGGLPVIWMILLVVGFFLSLLLIILTPRGRFPLQFAAFLWIVVLILFLRPGTMPRVWVFLEVPFVIWSASGIVGFLKDMNLKSARNVSVTAIVINLAMLGILTQVILLTPTIPDQWMDKGPEEKTILALKDQLTPSDLIIIDPPQDAPVWYYSKLYGLSDRYYFKSKTFDRLFVIVSSTDGQSLQSVLQSRGPDPNLFDLAAANLIMNYGYLDTYLVPHR